MPGWEDTTSLVFLFLPDYCVRFDGGHTLSPSVISPERGLWSERKVKLLFSCVEVWLSGWHFCQWLYVTQKPKGHVVEKWMKKKICPDHQSKKIHKMDWNSSSLDKSMISIKTDGKWNNLLSINYWKSLISVQYTRTHTHTFLQCVK